jgi:hypothetical protein
MMNRDDIDILWLRPSTGKNVSVRRERIVAHLDTMGFNVTLMDTSGLDAISAVKEAIIGDYDIIVGTVRVGLQIGFLLSRILRKPFIGSVSDPLERQKEDLPLPIYKLLCHLEWAVLRRADDVFFVHPESKDDAEKRKINGKLSMNSVNYEVFSNPDAQKIKKAKTELTGQSVDIEKNIGIYIGAMTEGSHLKEIVDTAELAPEWEFVFIGEEWGANIACLVSDVDNAYFLGTYDHELIPGFLYHATAAFCLVDNQIPLKVTEYGAAGLPTLGYPGKLKQVFSGDEIIYVDPDPMKISEKLRRISKQPECAQKYANNLQGYASENRWRDIAVDYSESIRRIVNE